MGRPKDGLKKSTKVDKFQFQRAVGSDEEDELDQQLEDLLDDEIDKYNAERQSALLKEKKKSGKSGIESDEDEQEVYGIDLSDDEDDNEGADDDMDTSDDGDENEDHDEDNDADIYGNQDEDDSIPDSRAWGRKAKVYHNTDYVDQDFGAMEGSDAEMAEQEEAEAKEIQKRLTAELDESDFLDLIPVKHDKAKKLKSKEILKVDFDALSMSEKTKLVQRECPEVIHFLEEYKSKLEDAKTIQEEIKKCSEQGTYLEQFLQTKYHTILNYCINISYFLYLRATNPSSCKGHPVIQKILQFRRLLDELSQVNPYKVVEGGTRSVQKKMMAKKKKPIRKAPKERPVSISEMTTGVKDENQDDEKRAITYEMAKNKGLTPHRRKELRNPRVKNRMKYRKATMRRKGQVRKPRTEVQKYGGELSGIKAHVTKSIKLK